MSLASAKATFKAKIKTAFLRNLATPTAEQQAQADVLAGEIADGVEDFVKAATITYTTGLTAGGDPVTGTFGNTIV